MGSTPPRHVLGSALRFAFRELRLFAARSGIETLYHLFMQHRSPRPPRTPLALAVLIGLCTLARPGGTQPEPSGPVSAPQAPAAQPASSAAPSLQASPHRRSINPAGIAEAARKLAGDAQRWGGTAGVMVLDTATGEVLASLNAHAAFNPASNAKLITAAAALRVLGPQHRFLTGLYGKPTGDRLGEVVLRGRGDPSIETADLRAMALELRASGIRKVNTIAVDQGYFDDQYIPPAFEQQPNEWAPFRAPIAAVSLNQNTVLFTVRPGDSGENASVSVEPPGFVDITGAVRTTAKSEPEKIALNLEGRGARLAAQLGGNVPEKSRAVRIARRIEDPRLFAGYALRAVLKETGIEVSGEVRPGTGKEKRLLTSHRSAPLGELVTALGKESDNFYAEMLLKTLGADKSGGPATTDAGAGAALRIVREMGAFEEGVIIRNGSGLFNGNRTTPWSTVALLRSAYRDASIGPEFVAHLAIGGVDGTLRGRFRAWSASRAIRAKTGTLDAVAALSGYVLAPDGGAPVAFAIYVNGISGKVSGARQSIDKVVDVIALELWGKRP